MDRETIELRVREIIAKQLDIPLERVTPAAHLEKDLGADSLDAIEIIQTLECACAPMSIPDEDAAKLARVSDMVAYIEARQGGRGDEPREAPAA